MRQDISCDDGATRRVTFLGRGLGVRSLKRLTLLVCPLCSQWNGERMAAEGICQWCTYEPDMRDEEVCCTAL